MKHTIPDEVLRHHTAVVGKTGSGKTSTEKLIVEQVVAAGARVCVLDTQKSDWWGITSSASGKSPGLPFQILGGPRGHVPLHSSAGKVIGQLVGTGKLPLSIVDMADFEPGGVQRFFVDFAQSLFRNVRGVVYLVIEEAHEIAPKERAGFGAENMAIHWAKKLATGSRTKGIKLIVATQRVQALHNAVLGSCETLIAHRLTMDADQTPVMNWLKSASKDKAAEVGATLASLPTGTGWICSGEAMIFEKVAFPKFKTFDNTATPDHDSVAIDVKMAPVDQTALRDLIGEEVRKAEADDPKKLRERIAVIERDNRKLETERDSARKQPAQPSTEGLLAAETRGFKLGFDEAAKQGRDAIEVLKRQVRDTVKGFASSLDANVASTKIEFTNPESVPPAAIAKAATPAPRMPAPRPPTRQAQPSPQAAGDGNLSGPLQKIVDAVAWWNAMGQETPTNSQVGFVANYKPRGGSWDTYRSRLKSAGLLEYLPGGRLRLTDAGLSAARAPTTPPTRDQFHEAVRALLDTPMLKLLDPLLEAYPDSLDAETWGQRARYQPQGGSWDTYKSRLKGLDLITYPERGHGRASDWLFP